MIYGKNIIILVIELWSRWGVLKGKYSNKKGRNVFSYIQNLKIVNEKGEKWNSPINRILVTTIFFLEPLYITKIFKQSPSIATFLTIFFYLYYHYLSSYKPEILTYIWYIAKNL